MIAPVSLIAIVTSLLSILIFLFSLYLKTNQLPLILILCIFLPAFSLSIISIGPIDVEYALFMTLSITYIIIKIISYIKHLILAVDNYFFFSASEVFIVFISSSIPIILTMCQVSFLQNNLIQSIFYIGPILLTMSFSTGTFIHVALYSNGKVSVI